MSFGLIDEIHIDPRSARVYEHGWQSWSPTGCYPAEATSARPDHGRQQAMRFRPGKPAPGVGFQAEGLLVVDPGPGFDLRVFSARDPRSDVASIRGRLDGSRFSVSADGDVDVRRVPGTLGQALATVGEAIATSSGVGQLRRAPTVWCSWYHYFEEVTQSDIVENIEAIGRHDLPVDVVQIDDGWESAIGDWLETSSRFTSLSDLAGRIIDSGRTPGIWVAPFIVGEHSELAKQHPDWLVGHAGYNWDQRLYGLDLTHPGACAYLTHTFDQLRQRGYRYFKLDFLYAGALPGRRHQDMSAVAAYRSGLDVIRQAVGPDSYLGGCGAPILPSVGLLDAMRVSPDSYNPTDPDNGTDLLRGRPCIEARAWQHGRFWINDADCLVARPTFDRRAEWASVIGVYGGLRSISDRIDDLDDWGLEATRDTLTSAPGPAPFRTLPAEYMR